MIPTAEEFLAGYEFYRRRTGALPASERAIRAALAMAAQLAGGREEDEPAALLFAFASYRRAFPGAWRFMAATIALTQVRAQGATVNASMDEVNALLLRVMYSEAGFEDVRAWLAQRIRPSP